MITPLGNLTDLTELDVSRNQISDITSLTGLIRLTRLNLARNQVSDISALANLTGLTWLNLWWNQVSNISALEALTDLTELDLSWNQIIDVFPLVNNPGLSAGDTVDLRKNSLSTDSLEVYIPVLEARGVAVLYDTTPALAPCFIATTAYGCACPMILPQRCLPSRLSCL